MENCLGGSSSKRTIQTQKELHIQLQQLKLQQQQPPNQNFYTQQQHPILSAQQQQQRLAQQQQQQQQQQIKREPTTTFPHAETVEPNFNTTPMPMSIIPKFAGNCLHFPPPPDYPPPPKTPTATKTMSTANVKSAATTTATTAKANASGHHHHHQHHLHHHHHHHQLQQQQQQTQHQQHQQQHQQYQHQQQLQQQSTTTVGLLQQQMANLQIDNAVAVEASIVGSGIASSTVANNANHSSTSSSPSSSSATSATTIGISPCGRRHILPRYPDPDPDAIEVCDEQEPINVKAVRNAKTLGHIHQRAEMGCSGGGASGGDGKWPSVQQTTSMQLLHAHPHSQHDYSYAYYEPGAAMRHSNIPPPEQVSGPTTALRNPPPPNSIRALLSKGKKNKLLVSPATRQSYQTRLGMGGGGGSGGGGGGCTASGSGSSGASRPTASGGIGGGGPLTGENFYEEISSSEARHQLRPTATSHSAGSLNQSLVEEEFRRVQTRHRKILGELNLSVEAMLMPDSPPNTSPTSRDAPTVSVTTTSGQPAISTGSSGLRLSSTSADNICDANISELLNTVGPTDDLLSPIQSSTNAGFCADLDSGFSGSSGASYIGSLRLHKTNAALSHLMSTRQAAQSNTNAGGSGATSVVPTSASCSFAYATHSCRSFHRAAKQQQQAQAQHQQQQQQQQLHEDDSSSGFLTRASCGRRILNCAKIRAAEDPGPVVPTESKARSFWNRKGWRKLPGFSSTSSINDTGLEDEPKLNSGSWEDPLPAPTSSNTTPPLNTAGNNSGTTTTTTAQLHNTLRRPDPPNSARNAYNGLHPLIIPAPTAASSQHHHLHHHHHHQQQQQQSQHQHNKSCGSPSPGAGKAHEAESTTALTASSGASSTTIAGGSFSTNGGSAAVGVTTTTTAASATSATTNVSKKRLEHTASARTLHSEDSWCSEQSEQDLAVANSILAPVATTSDEEAVTEDERSVSSLSATNQRNSQLRSTFNKAKQHLSFDKWRSSTSNAGNNNCPYNAAVNGSGGGGGVATVDNCSSGSQHARRASTSCTMPTVHQPPREDLTTPGESPGGRLSRWFSIRRGSTHQYDVGGRDGRQSSSSSIDIPDAAAISCNEQHVSPQKLANSNGTNACKMPGVPENEDDDPSSSSVSTSRFDLDLMIPPGSRANGTARTAHTRLITPMLPPAPPGLSQQQLKRRHIVAAIVHSENSYVATLQRLVNDYKKPLEDSSPPVLSASKIGTLFHRLPEILQSHKLFRIALAECVRNWDRDEKLGDCFVSAFSKPRILEIYSGFINNFSAAMELAKMEEKRKSALADFFKVKQISAHDRLSFFGLMVKPVQRFPQFILFLQDLLKYTPQGHHDRMSLQLALTQLELLAELLNERKREAEQYQGFKEMLGHISGTFNTRSLTSTDGNRPRYLLREDNVTHMEFNQAGFIIKSKQRRLLLLNDKVICVSVAPKQSHDFGATEKLSFKWMYPVTDVEIVDNSTSATLSRILTAGLNRGGSLKSNSSSCNNGTTNTLPVQSPYPSATLEHSPAAQLTNGADNLCNEMSTLMYDYEVISRIHDLVGSLKGTYKELNSNTTRNVLNTIQGSIQRKDEEMAWVDSCCLQLIARNKSGKEETFTFQTQNPNVKKEWITELRLAQLALDTNNSPAWEASSTEPVHAYEQQQQVQQQQLQSKQSNKMPLFVKAMPVYKSQHQTEVRCGCYYSIANDTKLTGNARRRHKQQNYLWICTSDGTSSHIAVLSQHHQQAGNLRDVGSFDLVETQVTAMEFVKGLDNCKTREEYSSLLGDLIWMGTDSRKIVIYSAQNPEQEEQLGSCSVPGAVMRILYHFDAVYVALSNSTMLIYRRSYDGVWMLKEPQLVQLGESGLAVPSLLPINMNIYASCANRVYVLNALNGEIQKSFEVHHGANQQVNLMAHSGIGLWISLKNSTVLCLYHTETFKHLQDINIASSVLRNDSKKEQAVNNSSIFVTALMACKGLLWVGTNVGIAVTIPLPRLEGVPIISGGISMSCHAHFGPITFLLPLIPKVYPSYKPPPAQTLPAPVPSEPPQPPSMGDDLQLPAIDADPKKLTEADLDESTVILRRDLPKDDSGSGSASPSASMLRDLSIDADSTASSPRSSKLDKQNSLDQSFSAKIRASLANSPAFHRKRFRDLSSESARMSKTLPRGLGSAGFFNTSLHSNTSTLNHGEHGYCDVYGLYGKLIFVKEDYDAEEGTQGNLMDMMYEGMRRSDPELAAIPGKVSTLDRRLRMKASRPRSLDLSNWSVDSKSSSLYTSSGSEESMGIRFFGGRSVSRNSSSASHKTSGNGSDLGNISENGLMTTAEIHQHSTPKSEDGFKLMLAAAENSRQLKAAAAAAACASNATASTAPPPASAAAAATLKRKQKQTAKQQQQNADGPRTVITLMGGRGYWRHVWYNNSPVGGNNKSTLSSGASSPLIANSNDAHIVVWEKKL